MQFTRLTLLAAFFASVSAYEVTAYLGAACTGAELGHLQDDQNTPGLTNPEVTINAQCITIDQNLPADCDVYLCADENCDDQGTTVEGPRNAGTRVENQSFTAFQVGCQ
ncbi:hypothetical protein VKT23_016763 [Stygiomarasmius scandens]|uniref:Uncharacterized protein n=1 Tax=Marasmiellus scandens TaxID=2682957 RepID=A0ABR1ITU2_9AGAR